MRMLALQPVTFSSQLITGLFKQCCTVRYSERWSGVLWENYSVYLICPQNNYNHQDISSLKQVQVSHSVDIQNKNHERVAAYC